MDEAYDGLGATYDLFWEEYSRNSIDGESMPLNGHVHFFTQGIAGTPRTAVRIRQIAKRSPGSLEVFTIESTRKAELAFCDMIIGGDARVHFHRET